MDLANFDLGVPPSEGSGLESAESCFSRIGCRGFGLAAGWHASQKESRPLKSLGLHEWRLARLCEVDSTLLGVNEIFWRIYCSFLDCKAQDISGDFGVLDNFLITSSVKRRLSFGIWVSEGLGAVVSL